MLMQALPRVPPAEEEEEEEEEEDANPSMLQQGEHQEQQEAEEGAKQEAIQVLDCAPVWRVVRVSKPLHRQILHQRSACIACEVLDCLSPPGYPC